MKTLHSPYTTRLRLALLLVACQATAACGPRFPAALAPEVVAGIQSTYATSEIPQWEVKVDFAQTAYGGAFGLVGLLVDEGVKGAREKESAERARKFTSIPFRSFRIPFWTAIAPVVQGTPWLKAEPLQVFPIPTDPTRHRTAAPGADLALATSYFISQNARVFSAVTNLRFCRRGQSEKVDAGNVLYYVSAAIGPVEGDEAVQLWVADHGAAYRKTVAESAAESAKMLRYALQLMGGDPPKPLRQAALKIDLVQARGDFGISSVQGKMAVSVIEESNERVLFQVKNAGGLSGAFFSVAVKDIEFVNPK